MPLAHIIFIKNEIIECLTNFKEGNFKWITKMIFRGANRDNSRKVSVDELKLASDNLGRSLSSDEFEQKKELEY